MSSRVTGAGLALFAVALLAVALITPVVLPARLSLFAGHPTVANHNARGPGRLRRAVLGAAVQHRRRRHVQDRRRDRRVPRDRLCRARADHRLAVAALALALLTLRRSERRKGCARLLWIFGALAIACAAA